MSCLLQVEFREPQTENEEMPEAELTRMSQNQYDIGFLGSIMVMVIVLPSFNIPYANTP